ncbi:MAG: response regulator [Dongiaceae bacterium]
MSNRRSAADIPRSMNDNQPIRIIVSDDDCDLQRSVADYLEQHNIRAISVSGQEQMMKRVTVEMPDLMILDLGPNQESGLDLLRNIRSCSNVPVIATSNRCEAVDRVIGLELGADDYLTKPFSLRELLARVRAVLRRQDAAGGVSTRDAAHGKCRFGGWQLDRRIRSLTDPDGNTVAITKGDYALLLAFLEAPQRPLTREQLLQATRVHEDIFDRSIDVQILRLRRKLESDANAPRVIRTERGVGYVFALPVEEL